MGLLHVDIKGCQYLKTTVPIFTHILQIPSIYQPVPLF